MTRAAPRYIAILAALMRGPATTNQIQAAIGAKQVVNLRLALRQMRRHGLVHVAGWQPPHRADGGGVPSALWGRGAKAEATPIRGARMPKPSQDVGTEMVAFASLVRALECGPLTAAELAESSSYPVRSIWVLLRQMRCAGVIHIGCWDRTQRNPVAAYCWGQGKDATRPLPEPKRDIELRYYAKRKARAGQAQMLSALSANSSVFRIAQRA